MSYYGVNIRPNVSFKAEQTDNSNIITRPIDKVQGMLTDTVDVFVPKTEDEDRKKARHTAIYAVSTVFVLSILAALLNPKFSGKAISKVKEWSIKAESKMKTSNNPTVRKFYAGLKNVLNFSGGLFQFANNTKGMKDKGVSWLCKSKKFETMDDGIVKKTLQKCDSAFTKVMSKMHTGITNLFDKISKKTVFWEYKKVDKNLNSFEEVLKQYRTKLPHNKQIEFDAKIKQIAEARKCFTKENIANRLVQQENAMSDLQSKFDTKMWDYFKGFEWPKNKENIRKDWKQFTENLSFWAEDILMPQRKQFEKQGKQSVDVLLGNGKKKMGMYQELIDLVSPHISQEEKAVLVQNFEKTGKKLRHANISECREYFDKKRDLMLGGAPTDVLSAAATLAIGAAAIGVADTKEDRMSRAVKYVAPAIIGFGVHLTLTAMLVSGVKSLAIGLLTTGVTSLAGSWIKKHLIYKPQAQNDLAQQEKVNIENSKSLEAKVA